MLVRRLVWLALVFGSCLVPVAAEASDVRTAGMHRVMLSDPLDQAQMRAVVFYPADAMAGSTTVGLYRIDAVLDAPIAAGHFPLVILSHGNGGSPLAQHDLATSLAAHGFIVMAVLHPGDNYQDQSRSGTLSNLYGRPLQLSAAIDAVQNDPMLSGRVDVDRVGVIGYSAGGESALILAGAQPQPELLRRYCQQVPDDADACSHAGELISDRDDLDASADQRVAALMLLAPLGLMFGAEQLHDVQVPVLVYAGDHDRVLSLERNAQALANGLPRTQALRVLPGADHFVFMAPCSEAMHNAVPQLCEDEEGVDRVAIHDQLSADAVRFFRRTLGAMQTSSR